MLGVNKAIPAMLEARAAGHGRGGVFWHTQGAGKSLSMVFFAQKILRRIEGNWTFVIVTDRVELDDQIAKTFKATGAVSQQESQVCHAGSGAELRELLRGNHRYVFTLIHKFQTPEMLCDRPDVIVITDEAHRSQYDTLAVNMRAALPKALFVAFTGTPLIVGEERTREVFGDYVSIYDFQQSVEDHATVRLFYDNRTPELRLENPTLNDDVYALIIRQFQTIGARLLTADGVDLTDDTEPSRVMIRQIMGAVAQHDKGRLVLKLRASRQAVRRAQGFCEGRKPYGWIGDESRVLARMRALRRKPVKGERLSFQQIADRLNAAGTLNREGRPWSASRVHAVLRRAEQVERTTR